MIMSSKNVKIITLKKKVCRIIEIEVSPNMRTSPVDDIYGNFIREKRYEELANSAVLSARNRDVEEIINGLWNYSTKHLKEYIQVLIVLKIVIIETLMKAFYPNTSIH